MLTEHPNYNPYDQLGIGGKTSSSAGEIGLVEKRVGPTQARGTSASEGGRPDLGRHIHCAAKLSDNCCSGSIGLIITRGKGQDWSEQSTPFLDSETIKQGAKGLGSDRIWDFGCSRWFCEIFRPLGGVSRLAPGAGHQTDWLKDCETTYG